MPRQHAERLACCIRVHRNCAGHACPGNLPYRRNTWPGAQRCLPRLPALGLCCGCASALRGAPAHTAAPRFSSRAAQLPGHSTAPRLAARAARTARMRAQRTPRDPRIPHGRNWVCHAASHIDTKLTQALAGAAFFLCSHSMESWLCPNIFAQLFRGFREEPRM